MALGDEQIDRLIKGLDDVMAQRIAQLDEVIEGRINQVRMLINGASISVPEVKAAALIQPDLRQDAGGSEQNARGPQ